LRSQPRPVVARLDRRWDCGRPGSRARDEAPKPIADREPNVRSQLETILAAARDGTLSPNDFAYVRAGFFPEAAKAYQDMLAGVGKPDSVTLFERNELGDDRMYLYEVRYGRKVFRVHLGLAPDDKVSVFSLAAPVTQSAGPKEEDTDGGCRSCAI
jgi:hypothetical protein